jgi:hypothetical protein
VISALVVTALLAQTGEEASAPEPEPLPRHFAMYLSVLEPTATIGTHLNTGLQAVSLEGTSVRLGVVLAARHAILLGAGLTAAWNSGTQFNPNATTSVGLSVMPTYRFFVLPLRESGLAMYVEAHAFIGTQNLTFVTGTSLQYGGGLGFGAEYLFMRGFGIAAGTTLRVTGARIASFGMPEQSLETHLDLMATVAISLHFG